MTTKEKEQFNKIRKHLADLHERWEKDDNDGHCKSTEGSVSLIANYPNWFEANSNKKEYSKAKPKFSVEIYSYLFGPERLHYFNTIEKAYKEVMSWYY